MIKSRKKKQQIYHMYHNVYISVNIKYRNKIRN